jgi:hypothetical protein
MQAWYQGNFVPYTNDPGSAFILMGGYYRRRWTANLTRALLRFWLEHWKWIVTIMVAVAALIVNARR